MATRLPPLTLRPNTHNNQRRLNRPVEVFSDRSARWTALHTLRNLALDPEGRAGLVGGDPKTWRFVLDGAQPDRTPAERVEALECLRNVALGATGPAGGTPNAVRIDMWIDSTVRDVCLEGLAPDAPQPVREAAIGVLVNLTSEPTVRGKAMREPRCLPWVVIAAQPTESLLMRRRALRVLKHISAAGAVAQRRVWEDKKGTRDCVVAGAVADDPKAREHGLGVLCNCAQSLSAEMWRSRRVRHAVVDGADAAQPVAVREIALRCIVNFATTPVNRCPMWEDAEGVRAALLHASHNRQAAILKRQALSALGNLAAVVMVTAEDQDESGGGPCRTTSSSSSSSNNNNKAAMWQHDELRKRLLSGCNRHEPEDCRVQSFECLANISAEPSVRESMWADAQFRKILLEGAAPDNPFVLSMPLVEAAAMRALANLANVSGCAIPALWAMGPTSPRT